MNIEIPDFLIEMSKRMNADDNRGTSHPFWQVRHIEYLPTQEGYNEHHQVLVDEHGREVCSSITALDRLHTYMLCNHEQWCMEWVKEEHGFTGDYDDFKEVFENYFDLDCVMPEGYEVIHLQKIEKTVWTGFTEKAALEFINRKQHDYPKLYTYVESAYWSPELRNLQDWIKSLTS